MNDGAEGFTSSKKGPGAGERDELAPESAGSRKSL